VEILVAALVGLIVGAIAMYVYEEWRFTKLVKEAIKEFGLEIGGTLEQFGD